MKSDNTLHWWLCGLWCAGGALGMGALLTYLTSWAIGAVAGTVMGVVLAHWAVITRGGPHRQ